MGGPTWHGLLPVWGRRHKQLPSHFPVQVEVIREAVDAGEACFGTVDSWLIYKLTGGAGRGIHVTDGEAAGAGHFGRGVGCG